MKTRLLSFILPLLTIFSCNDSKDESSKQGAPLILATPSINFTIISFFPHDTTAFTEGLLMHDGKLYESTGYTSGLPQTKSLFGVVDLKTGKIDPKVELDKKLYFGEGITFLNGKVYLLTYQTKIGFVYDAITFKKLKEFTFPSKEGWGMTTDSTSLIMSDGTSNLTYLDASTLKPKKTLQVLDENGPVLNLNELEFIKGSIYANIYTTNIIVKIDTTNGKVIGKLDLTLLNDEQKNKFAGALEMNGIAFNPSNGNLYCTGKLWPNIYEIRLSQ